MVVISAQMEFVPENSNKRQDLFIQSARMLIVITPPPPCTFIILALPIS